MTYIGLGCLCFLFFILYDLNQIHKNHRGIRPLFAVGCHYALCAYNNYVSNGIRE